MKSINEHKSKYEEQYVNAIIDNVYIIPGINGIEVDKLNSYYEMKKEDSFNKEADSDGSVAIAITVFGMLYKYPSS